MDAPRPVRRRRRQSRPQQLLDAVLSLFVEKGSAATRAAKGAARAGVSRGTLCPYYPSKNEPFEAVVRHDMGQLIGEGGQFASAFAGSTAEVLAARIEAWCDRVAESSAGGLHKIMLAETRNFPELAQLCADEVMAPAPRLFADGVRRGVARGESRAVDPRATLRLHVELILQGLQVRR